MILGAALSIFCAHGGVGLVPNSPPPDFEQYFAVAVVQIDTPAVQKNLAVSSFSLLDKDGTATPMKRVVKIETFDEPKVAGEGEYAYYLNSADGSHSQPWNGTLPAGKTRLRIRVSFTGPSNATTRYALVLGPYKIGGPCDVEWPT